MALAGDIGGEFDRRRPGDLTHLRPFIIQTNGSIGKCSNLAYERVTIVIHSVMK